MPKHIKVLLKVLDENKDELVWEHLCYAPQDLYIDFLTRKDIERADLAEYICRWAKEDFNIDLPMSTYQHIKILRELVQDKYLTVYPHFAVKNRTDRQGWMRVWICDKMKKELLRK